MSLALVLGAGGTVGMAYHAGVLRALEVEAGIRPDDADLVIGTSAGSMCGAMLRSGLSTEDMWLAAIGEHPEIETERDGSPWDAAFRGPFDIARRLLGSAYVLQRSMVRVPVPQVPASLRRAFPGGFYTIDDAEETLADVLPTEWPDKPLWLVTVNVRTGRRVVLGRRNPPRTDLHSAVKASCAIPAFFQPIRVGRHTLVDGGVHSTTNLDLATKLRPDTVIGVVPMAYDPATGAPRTLDALVRRFAQSRVASETAQARRLGASVLLIRPTAEDLAVFGANMMRPSGNDAVARTAYESTARQLATRRARAVLDGLDTRQPV